MTDKVAVFLDVENLSGWLKAEGGEILLDRSTELGRVAVRRAYGDFSNQSVSVRQTDLNLLGFEFVHVYHPVKGKNSADIQIVVDVMEYIARIPDLKWFVLATGDSDFSPLFRRLRELGKSVVGVGPRSALSEAVKKSCNRFIYIDSLPNSDDAASLKAAQLREDALELLERVLKKLPEGANLSILKNKMLEIDSAFDESNLGFNGFKKFLQNAPEIVTLHQVKSGWHAKAADIKGNCKTASSNNSLIGTVPTTELYHRLLRKISWFSCELSFLWDALTKLDRHFPEGFTRSEEFEYLIKSFGHNRTRKEIRAAICVLFKSGFVIYGKFQNQDDESVLFTEPPESERSLAEKVDAAMLPRLINACEANNVSLEIKALTPLLLSTYSKEELRNLINNAQEQRELFNNLSIYGNGAVKI
jgi:NYN domain/OST-HTH/LOTUS domain